MNFRAIYNRTIYVGYYLKKMDWHKFNTFLKYASKESRKARLVLFIDAVLSVYRYNIGLIDYFYFRFYTKIKSERNKWVGTGYKYEYDLVMNKIENREILQNKLKFFDTYYPYIKHGICRVEDIEENNDRAKPILENGKGKLALKDALGQCGWDVEIVNAIEFSRDNLLTHMKAKGFNMAEEFIQQHSDLASLSNTGLNTVRLITQLDNNDEVHFIGPTLRITVNSAVDNMAMGNIAAPIDEATGIVKSEGVYQDITKENETHHPVTGQKIVGFQVPHWDKVLNLCREAALYNKTNRSIGWDVAITEEGPSLLEGNHNWCKLLWQLPLQEGRKSDLEKYLKSYKS